MNQKEELNKIKEKSEGHAMKTWELRTQFNAVYINGDFRPTDKWLKDNPQPTPRGTGKQS